MKFKEFKINNFKGINSIVVSLDKSPNANVYTLIGLNESGKTSILEAINFFDQNNEALRALDLPGSKIEDYNSIIPISKRDNYTGISSIEATIKFESDDIDKINNFISENTKYEKISTVDEIRITRNYEFKDSTFVKTNNNWTGIDCLQKNSTEICKLSKEENKKIADFCKGLIPSILYFPNFLFDFPSKIYLESNEDLTAKETFYFELIQDILFSLENDTTIETHLIARIKSVDENDKRNLMTLLKKMNNKVTAVVFGAWNEIFSKSLTGTKVQISYGTDKKGSFLQFDIETGDGIYKINERSLGFRWFFTFLLFTQFRPFRKDSTQNIIFLFDEPASNLHSNAQKQLLKSFENLTKNNKIIYATHSHHLVNSKWLESTYVVKNEGLNLENIEDFNIKQTDIKIIPYRTFVTHHPHNTAYFQPILDVLDYVPSDFDNINNAILMEGKNDFYTLQYFKDIILNDNNCFSIIPSTGSGNLDTLISLYIGWGKNFIILLDSDKEGHLQKNRYISEYGIYIESKVFTLGDIDPSWNNFNMEDLFTANDKINLQLSKYFEAKKYKKTIFNRTIQEYLINKEFYEFENTTNENFAKVLNFFSTKLS
ncbi:ATP-dependent nuclease [Flavobacterium poyangense]|uniref:ATP-dependent nuclease n=1 Tax=Flavobacterium poyangense TaxID=2204302 RepID=UPI00141FF2A1|nr:AAA family ATPase [Flavobacterium sp. JXAS1]